MMFSQLCRAKPGILRNKFGIGQQPPRETDENQRTIDTEFSGEDRCRLQHCTFCDFRLCCQVASSPPCSPYNWQTDRLQESSDSDAQVTENPAYGLSSKNFLEAKDDDGDNDEQHQLKDASMELTEQKQPEERSANCDTATGANNNNISPSASQQLRICDVNYEMNQANLQSHHFQQNRMELRSTAKQPEDKHEFCCADAKHGKLTWSVLRHRQLGGDAPKNCDNKTSNVIGHTASDADNSQETTVANQSFVPAKSKKMTKDQHRSFPLSLMRPIAKMGDKKAETSLQRDGHVPKNDLSRQRPVQRHDRGKFQNSKDVDKSKRQTDNDVLGLNSDPLSDIAQVKSEESVQEWLARIGESAAVANSGARWPEDSSEDVKEVLPPQQQRHAWSLVNSNNTDEEKGIRETSKRCYRRSDVVDDALLLRRSAHAHPAEISRSRENLCYDDEHLVLKTTTEPEAAHALCKASKASPANVPMVVMQCSRLHSHIECKPPFQQTSLPMGTLVTALYQESEWLYVQTPHGVEGFVLASNCAPIGTVNNEPAAQAKKPWEPCDFPIQICLSKKRHELGRQQGGSYIPAKLPPANVCWKQAAPYVSTVKMKTNFYSDRYFSHTFKSKDSIKTAKTVTDILRSSPETKVSNQ